MGAIIGPFFINWGGLSQFQIQTLQSWFMFSIFLFEIPTGVIGDVKGNKYSMVLSYIFKIMGVIVYTIYPSFWLFLLGELIFAVGSAFSSGSWEALVYNLSVETKAEKDFGKIWINSSNMHLIAMILSSFLGAFMTSYWGLEVVFRITAISYLVTIFLLFFLKEPKEYKKKELKPNYKKIVKNAVGNIKNSPALKRITIFISLVYVIAYFVLWFFPTRLVRLGVPESEFGLYRFILIFSEIVLSLLISRILVKQKRKRWILTLTLFLIGLGYMFNGIENSVFTILLMMVFVGGIGLKYREIIAPYINRNISPQERATTLSFMGMVRTLSLAIVNPIIGWIADWNFSFSLFLIAGLAVITGLFFVPKEEDLIISDTK